MIIRDILASKPSHEIFSISPESTVADAVKQMAERNIGSLVVMRGGKMVGLITERDVVRATLKVCDLCDVSVAEVMVAEPVVGGPDDSVDYVRGVMTETRISHLPVVSEGELIGIISFHDVARAALNEAAFENRLLKRYIKHWPE
jgi:CBS domain-containing protein